MASDNFEISVIIPTYNRIQTLERAIDSVEKQTFKDIEIIVIDDNIDSEISLKVQQICDKRQGDIHISVYKTSGGQGGGAARNLGCSKAVGKYLAFLDDDDIYLPEKLEKQYFFTVQNGLDMSFQDIIWLNEKDEIVEYRKFDYITDCSNKNLLKEHLMHNIAPTSIYFIKRDRFLLTKGFGEIPIGQDIFLMYDCINLGLKIGYMKGAYVRQYLHSGDRVSKGKKKLDGENWWYREKRKYLNVLSRKEKRFFRFRHYAIMTFACLRSGYYIRMLGYLAVAFFMSPVDFCVEGVRYLNDKAVNRGA